MTRKTSRTEKAVGRLISAIQKIWIAQAGTDRMVLSEDAMDRAHSLLQAEKLGQLNCALASRSIADYLGSDWVGANPSVARLIAVVDRARK